MLLVRIDVWTYWRMNVLTYWCMNVLTYEHLNVWMYRRMNFWTDDWMNLWADGCHALCMNDRKDCRRNVLLICQSYDWPSDLPSDRNFGRMEGQITAVFGRMDFNYFFGEFFGFFGMFLFFHSFADSVKRYFCRGWLGWSGYSRSIAPSSNAGLR